MALFKKKQKKEEKTKAPEQEQKGSDSSVAKDSSISYRVLRSPQVSEKSSFGADRGVYTFKVKPDSNKLEIKEAVEKLYNVTVEKVNIVNVSGKARQFANHKGMKSGYKKATITLVSGQTIDAGSR